MKLNWLVEYELIDKVLQDVHTLIGSVFKQCVLCLAKIKSAVCYFTYTEPSIRTIESVFFTHRVFFNALIILVPPDGLICVKNIFASSSL